MNPGKYFLLGVILTAAVYVEDVNSANILVLTFFSTKSHMITYMHLMEELGRRNHSVTVVSPIKIFKDTENVKHIFTLDTEKIVQANEFDVFEQKKQGTQMDISKFASILTEACQKSYQLPQVKSLLNQKFDLIFFPLTMNDCVLGLAYRLGAPLVAWSPIGATNLVLHQVGGHHPTSFIPNILTGYNSEMNFYQRFVNFGVDVMAEGYMSYIFQPNMEKIYRDALGNDIPSINEIAENVSLVLSNTHFSLTNGVPNLPNVVDIGGIHSRPAKPVPKDLEEFIQKGKDGFIFFSMGTVIKEKMMPEEQRKMILRVFSKLKQQVLWKWESETMPDLPKNVKLSKWLPQQDLLGHKDIKMFITHCGGGSTEEAIYQGVPLVGLPMMGDQPQNSALAKRHGMLVELDWLEMTEESFEGAINEVLNNPIYRENAKRISTLFKDRPIDPLENGVYWVEYILRHKGAPHLRSAGRKLNSFQYHSYDVIGAYLAIISALLYIIYSVLKLTFRKLFCSKKKSLVDDKKNN